MARVTPLQLRLACHVPGRICAVLAASSVAGFAVACGESLESCDGSPWVATLWGPPVLNCHKHRSRNGGYHITNTFAATTIILVAKIRDLCESPEV